MTRKYRSRFLTDDQVDDLRRDIEAGIPDSEIRDKYGYEHNASISYWRKRFHLKPLRSLDHIDWENTARLYTEQNLTLKQLSEMLGCSICAILNRFEKKGIKRRKKGKRNPPP